MKNSKPKKRKKAVKPAPQPGRIYFYCPQIVTVGAGEGCDVVVVLKDLPDRMRELFLEWTTLEDRPQYSDYYAYYNDFYDWFKAHSKDFTNA